MFRPGEQSAAAWALAVLGRRWLARDPSDDNSALHRVPEESILVLCLCSGLRKREVPGRDHATRCKLRVGRVAASPGCCVSLVENNPALVVDSSRCCSQDELREDNDACSGRALTPPQ